MKQIHFRQQQVRQQQGFSLIEVLITVVVLAIGSLGIASMQIAGLKYSAGAYARSQATHLADDMASRLKSNREQALDLQPDGDFGDNSAYRIEDYAFEFTTSSDCITNTCSAAELTDFDKQEWLQNVARALPSGRGKITYRDQENGNGVTERIYLIDIQWREVSNSSDQDGAVEDDIDNIIFRVAI